VYCDHASLLVRLFDALIVISRKYEKKTTNHNTIFTEIWHEYLLLKNRRVENIPIVIALPLFKTFSPNFSTVCH